MKDFQTRAQPKSKIMYSWLFIVFLAIILLMFARSAYFSFNKKQTADAQKEKYEQQLNDLEDKKTNLEDKIENLTSERGMEEELRKRFNVVKEGETMIRIIDKK
jgi:cell division protein FtsB